MATDSATLERRTAARPRREEDTDTPEIRSPAAPIARGIGLDQPFFEDKNRAFWILQSIGWSGYFFLRSLSGFANSMGWMWLVHTVLLTMAGYSLTLLMASLFRRLIRMRPLVTLIFSLLVVILASSAFSIIETWSYATFLKPNAKPVGVEYLGAILLNFSLLAAWAALYYGINYFLLLEDQIRQRERLEGQASSAQLAMLRYQLNPHFLFNTLNSISALIREDQAKAERTVQQLSALLRYSLDTHTSGLTRLGTELRIVTDYLEIEKTRFGDRLKFTIDVPGALEDLEVPPMAIQTLVENSIKHAISPSRAGGEIRIVARTVEDRFLVEVSDDGPGFAANDMKEGHGLDNLRERLAAVFAEDASLRIISGEEGGATVTLSLPRKRVLV
jgi:sensor histidine kinase YesM